jgi:hypothetical protein
VCLRAGDVSKFADIDITTLLPTPKNIHKLRRSRVNPPPSFPLSGSSFSASLYMHHRSIVACGHIQLAKAFSGLLRNISKNLSVRNIPIEHRDSYIRKYLKNVHEWAYPKVFSCSPSYMFMCHLHSLGGKAPFTREQIRADIQDWVDDKKEFSNPALTKRYVDEVFSSWKSSLAKDRRMSPSEYYGDVVRWGTSGGAPKTKFLGKQHRTKWAWGWSRTTTKCAQGFRYENKITLSNPKGKSEAHVALKEEAAKTREVITTPMDSYLRQSYLSYCWGRPNLNSPIGKSTWLSDFQVTAYKWYGAIDGSRFDHCVPKWFVTYILYRLGRLDSRCRLVAAQEIASLERLEVVDGEDTYKYKGGLLSGWRLTSLIGSIASYCAGRYIIDHLGLPEIQIGVMGDDIILYSNSSYISATDMADLYHQFGISVNTDKTVSSPIGEFLRKVYSPSGVYSYPALGLKSIMYANPWLSTFNPSDPSEMATNWITWYSRLLPLRCDPPQFGNDGGDRLARFIQSEYISDLRRWHSKFTRSQYLDWICTPLSAGGGGPLEWSKIDSWCTIKMRAPIDRNQRFFDLFGFIESDYTEKEKKSFFRMYPIVKEDILQTVDLVNHTFKILNEIDIPKHINITKQIVTWFFDRKIPTPKIGSMLSITLPNGLRVTSKLTVLEFILGKIKGVNILTSAQCSPDFMSSELRRIEHAISTLYLTRKSASYVRNYPAAITLLSCMWFGGYRYPTISW